VELLANAARYRWQAGRQAGVRVNAQGAAIDRGELQLLVLVAAAACRHEVLSVGQRSSDE
jgi:hypothetical protein